MLETPARQPFLAEFATRNNRENLSKNRDLLSKKRETPTDPQRRPCPVHIQERTWQRLLRRSALGQ